MNILHLTDSGDTDYLLKACHFYFSIHLLCLIALLSKSLGWLVSSPRFYYAGQSVRCLGAHIELGITLGRGPLVLKYLKMYATKMSALNITVRISIYKGCVWWPAVLCIGEHLKCFCPTQSPSQYWL